MTVPSDLAYTSDHEWVRVDGDIVTVGITAHAAEALGDIVFVATPAVGGTITAGQACGEVESTKSVSDLNAPVSGEVVEVNQSLVDEPGLVNSDPYGVGWLFRVRADGPVDGPVDGRVDGLLDAAAYTALTVGG